MKTDWNRYYKKPYRTSSFSRKIIENHLINHMKRFSPNSIIELGGANSCFYDGIMKNIKPKEYIAIDKNVFGLEKLKQKKEKVIVCKGDVLMLPADAISDIVFSVGLIEHFNKQGTQKAIKAHFDLLKNGGIAIISFPTPTFLYNFTRYLSETLSMWIFHDERPLRFKEVLSEAKKYGKVIDKKIIWPIFLTQGMIVVKKS